MNYGRSRSGGYNSAHKYTLKIPIMKLIRFIGEPEDQNISALPKLAIRYFSDYFNDDDSYDVSASESLEIVIRSSLYDQMVEIYKDFVLENPDVYCFEIHEYIKIKALMEWLDERESTGYYITEVFGRDLTIVISDKNLAMEYKLKFNDDNSVV